ncbi:MAG: hypothetical protein E6Q97_01170 [Desulfurellales bacterium]|nr:MAG: hypothetical protein E6Q97_01170 [Desulfurellales bacterium]
MPDPTPLSRLLAAVADLGAAMGGFLGTIGAQDVDTLTKSQSQRAATLGTITTYETLENGLTETQEALKSAMLNAWDDHDATFAGGN